MSNYGELPFCFTHEEITEGDFVISIPPGIHDKQTLLARFAELGQFPAYFGYNWDAFEEILRDFHWIGDRRIVISHGDLPLKDNERELRTYLDILKGTRHPAMIVFPSATREKIVRLMSQ